MTGTSGGRRIDDSARLRALIRGSVGAKDCGASAGNDDCTGHSLELAEPVERIAQHLIGRSGSHDAPIRPAVRKLYVLTRAIYRRHSGVVMEAIRN